MAISPPPLSDRMGTHRWLEWFRQVSRELIAVATVAWSGIDFSGSNITDIATRNHNNLQNIQGGTTSQYYHLTSTQHGNLTGNSIQTPTYTVADAPSASTEGAGSVIYVSNGAAGNPVLAFSNGTNWLRSDDLTAISAT